MPRIGQTHLEAPRFQHIVKRDPVYAGRLHHDRLDAACFQPVGHPLQICRPASELLHWLRIATWGHRHVVAFIANVNARDVAVDDLQSRLLYTQLSLQISALLPVQPPVCQTLQSCFLPVCHVTLPLWFEWIGFGSAGDDYTISPTGSSLAFFKDSQPPITEFPPA